MTPEMVQAFWFSPFAYAIYLGVPFTIWMIYLQWKWSKVCRENVLVLVSLMDGGTLDYLVPKEGGSVSLKKKNSDTTRMWPINKMTSLDMPYPGVGFLPRWLQKDIKMIIVDEGDYEPLINRDPKKAMIASPAVLGNLMHEKITEAVITVNKEVMDKLEGLARRLGSIPRPMPIYIGLLLIIILQAISLFTGLPIAEAVEEQTAQINVIKSALGIK